MSRSRWGLAAALVLAATWYVSGRQGQPHPGQHETIPPASSPAPGGALEDRLAQPTRLPFAEETSLADVAVWLKEQLHAQVVIDRAAMERHGLTRESTVQLELENVRLRTALRLLLDQLEMAYRLEPEDNIIVLTDAQGAGEPLPRILDELEALHRDLHVLQDTVDELYDALLPEVGPMLRDPAIIEKDREKAIESRHDRTRPG